jgi:DNA polymerase-3 subunit beta
MKLTIERDAAQALMARAEGAVLSRTPVPILEMVLLDARKDRLTICATDQAMQFIGHAPAAVESEGAIAVPAGRLNDLLRNLPSGAQVSMQLTDHRLTVKCGRSRFVLPTLPAVDFSSFSLGGMEHQAEVPAKDLLRLLAKTAFAICKEQTRYYMTGACLHVVESAGGRRLRMVATNGAALAYAETSCPDDWAETPGFTIPDKSVGELQRQLDGVAGEVSIGFSGSLFHVEAETWSFATKLLDQGFPDYQRVIPPDAANVARLDLAGVSASLKRCGLMAGDKTRSVRLSLSPDAVTLRARDGQGGEAEDEVDGDYTGDPLELSYSGKQLQEILGAMAGEQVEMRFAGPNDPVKFRDSADAAVLFICIPQRV